MPKVSTLEHWYWRHGKHLSKAQVDFAPPDMADRYRRAHDRGMLQAVQDVTQAQKQLTWDELANHMMQAVTPRTETAEACQNAVRQLLQAGRLVGFGFEPPRRLDASPVRIPTAAWRGIINWHKGTLEHQGLKFVEIGVIVDHWQETLAQQWREKNAPPPPKTRRGPESTASLIADAYVALRDAGQIDPAQSTRARAGAIRTWLCANHPDRGFSIERPKPSDETIRAAIRDLVQADRERQK